MNKMTRQELIDELSLCDDLGTKAAAERVLDTLTDIITVQIKQGNEVYLGQHFGGFKAANQSARSGIANGVKYSTPAKTVIKFRPSSKLKEEVA